MSFLASRFCRNRVLFLFFFFCPYTQAIDAVAAPLIPQLAQLPYCQLQTDKLKSALFADKKCRLQFTHVFALLASPNELNKASLKTTRLGVAQDATLGLPDVSVARSTLSSLCRWFSDSFLFQPSTFSHPLRLCFSFFFS